MNKKITDLNQIRQRQTEELNNTQMELDKVYKLIERHENSINIEDIIEEKDNEIKRLQQEIQHLLDDDTKIITLEDIKDIKTAVIGGRPKQLKKLHAQYENFILLMLESAI